MNHRIAAPLFLTFTLASFGCGDAGGGSGGGGSGAGGDPPLSDATELTCPTPGALPFKLESHDWNSSDSKLTAEGSPRFKDEAADTLGVPGGLRVNTYIPVDDVTDAEPQRFDGRKARTGQNSGLTAIPLRGEAVSLWYYDPSGKAWQSLGHMNSDDDGRYTLAPATAITTELDRPVYSILEADGSCAEHYEYLLPEGTKFIVADIDGTLTQSDDELFKQIDDGTYLPKEKVAADLMMNAWHDKGYRVVYLTARPHQFRAETRAWLHALGFPPGPVLTANSLVVDDSARSYKRSWMNRMIKDFKWDVVAAYGNASSDIDAYADAGISKDITFIIGDLAGTDGTQPIANDDYTDHVADFVDSQPDL